MFYTYLWLRENGTPYYVGKGSGDRAFNPNGHRVHKPLDDARIIVQEFETEDDAFFAEKFLIALYGRTDNATGCLSNLTDGGENPPSCKGKKKNPESVKKTAEGNRGQKRTKEQRLRMSEAHKGLPSKRKGCTQVAWNKGLSWSEETIKKIGEAGKGRIPWNKGKQASAETRRKQSESHKGQVPWNKGKSSSCKAAEETQHLIVST